MKCTNCGHNLQIDNAHCPFCGSVNPIAKQHREDMKQYAKDFGNTKKAVLTNSKKFNSKSLRITAIAITIAVIAVLIPIAVQSDSLGRSFSRNRTVRTSDQHLSRIQELIAAEDYIALNEFVLSHELYTPRVYDGKYHSLFRAVSGYNDMYDTIFYILKQKGNVSESYAGTVERGLHDIILTIQEKEFIAEDCQEFIKSLDADTALLLSTYLNIPEEDYRKMFEMNSSKRTVMIEEAINEFKEKY